MRMTLRQRLSKILHTRSSVRVFFVERPSDYPRMCRSHELLQRKEIVSETVGYIGLGDMGGAMSETLTASYDLVVFDLSDEAIAKLVEKGARAATSGASLAAECAHISICVPDDTAVMEVVSGTDGILASCRPGTSIAVHSTVHPDTIRDLHVLAAEREVILFDAGVAGGSWAAREGSLVIMLGVPEAGISELARGVIDECAGRCSRAVGSVRGWP